MVPGTVARPPLAALNGEADLAHVKFAERPVTCDEAAVYPSGSAWVITASSGPGADALANLVATHREVRGEWCCAGDAWVSDALGPDRGDPLRWQWASLVHWMSASVELSRAVPG